jgi:nitric oxide reductase subunit B
VPKSERLGLGYLTLAALALGGAAAMGSVASLSHGWPGQFFELSAFRTMRPIHVTLSIGWIFLAYMGALHFFVPRVCRTEWHSPTLARLQILLIAGAGAAAPISYLFGKFSGREYLAFVPAISAILMAGWIVFLINFFLTIRKLPRPWPVYLWMWATGLVIFPITFAEGHLWLIPFFRDNIARDLTVQWKSYGALIGSWNHVVYGLSIYMAERISGDERIGRSRLAFAFYWLGLANLMFGWAHHTFQIPQAMEIRVVAFAMSMTEWTILAHMLWTWAPRGEVSDDPARGAAALFLRSANVWIGVNLCFALLISVPMLNALTHGTPATIAHAMGTTIGINTFILLSCLAYILVGRSAVSAAGVRFLRRVVPWSNICLAGMFLSLLAAGGVKGKAMLVDHASFYSAMESARPYLRAFSISGIGLGIGLLAVAIYLLTLIRARVGAPAPWPQTARLFPKPAYSLFVFGLASLPWWIPAHRPPEPPMMSGYPEGEDETCRKGREIFSREGCWKCHGGDSTALDAPDLRREGPAWSAGWHAAHLFDPRLCRATSTMPHFSHLFQEGKPTADGSALIGYLLQIQRSRARQLSASLDAGLEPTAGRPDPMKGHMLYQKHCSSCHGPTGGGDGPASGFFGSESLPRNLTLGLFRNRSTRDAPTDQDLWLTITHGMPGSAMAGFRDLGAQDRHDLVAYVRTLSRRASDRDPAHVPPAPPPTPELVARGMRVATEARCAQCHGSDWKGLHGPTVGLEWTDESGRPVPHSTDVTSGIFKSGSTPSRLYRTLFYGRGGAPMPCYLEMIPQEQDRWALVHYVRSLYSNGP